MPRNFNLQIAQAHILSTSNNISSLKGQRVLVVDDMQLNQFLMGELLKNCGLVPVFAGNGQEALQLATKEAFAFIHDMFEYNGEETLNICGMGDCPGIKTNNIPAPSVGIYQVTWQEDVGVQSKQTKLCQDCKDYLLEKKMIQDI